MSFSFRQCKYRTLFLITQYVTKKNGRKCLFFSFHMVPEGAQSPLFVDKNDFMNVLKAFEFIIWKNGYPV